MKNLRKQYLWVYYWTSHNRIWFLLFQFLYLVLSIITAYQEDKPYYLLGNFWIVITHLMVCSKYNVAWTYTKEEFNEKYGKHEN